MNYKVSDRDVFFKLRRLDKYMEGHKGFLAGGVFKNVFNNEKVRDVDVFFEKEEDFKECLVKFEKDVDNYQPFYKNDNCVAFKNIKTKVVVELVKVRFLPHEELINMFDFSIVRACYYKEENEEGGINYKFKYIDRFFEDLHQKKLVIDIDFRNIPLPINTFERTYKYQRYGYGLCRESKIKLLEAIRLLQGDIDVSNQLYMGLD